LRVELRRAAFARVEPLLPQALRFGSLPFFGLALSCVAFRLPRCLQLGEHAFERLDEALRVGAKALMREPDGIAAREGFEAFGQFRRARHRRVVHQHRNDALFLLQRRLDLDAHEVFRTVEPPRACLVGGVEPVLADHRDQHVAARDLVVQHLHEVEARRDIVHVHEQPLGRKHLFEAAIERLGEARIVAAAIIDEDVAGHGPPDASVRPQNSAK
jgi:hypothetical protein